MPVHPGIFRQYDIRGIIDRDLTTEAATAIGRAYASLLHERGISGTVAVGRDNRPSGGSLRDALIEGLTSGGLSVTDIGVVPTPLLYWSLHHLDVQGGIQITGSHNPPEYNGFKLCVGHDSLHGDGIDRLRQIIEAGNFAKGAGSVRSERVIDRDATKSMVDETMSALRAARYRPRFADGKPQDTPAVTYRQLFVP